MALTTDNGQALLPTVIRVEMATLRFTPNELRALKVATGGRALQEVMTDEADAIQAAIWIELRRAGHTTVTWDQAGEIEADISTEPLDPTNVAHSNALPSSATSGE